MKLTFQSIFVSVFIKSDNKKVVKRLHINNLNKMAYVKFQINLYTRINN